MQKPDNTLEAQIYARNVKAGNIWTRVTPEQRAIALRAGNGKTGEGIRVALEFWNIHHPSEFKEGTTHPITTYTDTSD